MQQNGWEATIAKIEPAVSESSGLGCLLQIHPLEISAQLIELGQQQTVVGRDLESGVRIADASVSRRHALIERIAGKYQVTDLESTNGTCINERRVESAELSPGDRIQFGSFIFKFLEQNHIELEYHEAVYAMMTRDGLTGTLNKRSFLDLIAREFRRAVHRRTPLSLIMFDIDHFKSINDTHGHLAGDEVLQCIAERIETVIAKHDVFARYGGEEFAILLPDVEAAEAVTVAERCRQAIEMEEFPTSVGPLEVRISVGVADVSSLGLEQGSDAESPSLLIQAADTKLYVAKNSGRNRVCC